MKQFANPILFISDNPSLHTGLARQSRDIATLACTLPQFRVGFMGRGIGNRRKFPFTLYDYPESGQWGENYIKQVWEDFSDGQEGVICTCDDLSRRHWFARGDGLPNDLATFVGRDRNYRKWAYVPVDSTGPDGRVPPLASRDCASLYDRVLATSEWGCATLKAGGRQDTDWLPHGIFSEQFHRYPDARKLLDWDKYVVVGSVMANQSRKDYPALFDAIAHLRNHYTPSKFRAWLHVDTLIRYWNVYALAADYGVGDVLEVTVDLNDEQLALRYSACDCTLLPSAGEGFGYPIAESLMCGTSCIVTDYAAGPELVAPECRVRPVAFRVDTQHNVLRAVLSGIGFGRAAIEQVDKARLDPEYRSGELHASVEHLDWNNLRGLWQRWLLGGLR